MELLLKPLQDLSEKFRSLDGVGKKSAIRMAFSVLNMSEEDAEAFALFKQYVETARTARDAYERANGPLKRKAAAKNDSYTWLQDPWPWNFEENEVK